jgi:hypothetical protein
VLMADQFARQAGTGTEISIQDVQTVTRETGGPVAAAELAVATGVSGLRRYVRPIASTIRTEIRLVRISRGVPYQTESDGSKSARPGPAGRHALCSVDRHRAIMSRPAPWGG